MIKPSKCLTVLLLPVLIVSLASCMNDGKVSGMQSSSGDLQVLCHYMTWFRYAEKDGIANFDHWAWDGKGVKHDPNLTLFAGLRDIASVYYPRIGVYDSSDPEVLDYHILTAKTAGIEGFVVDWYGKGGAVDDALAVLMGRAEELNFKIAICYEEKTCFPTWNKIAERDEAVRKAASDFKYMADKYLKNPFYFKKDGKPCVFIFSGWGDWPGKGKLYFTPEEWNRITEAAGIPLFVVRQNFDEAYRNIRAGFGWCGDSAYLDWFYNTGDRLCKEGKLDFYFGSACPGFDDRGVWGWGTSPRFEARLGTSNYSRYWDRFEKSSAKMIQLVTWNDFQEGTVIEPTVQDGILFMKETQKRTSAIRGNSAINPEDLEIPYQIFYLKGKLQGKPEILSRLEEAKKCLAGGNTGQAREITGKIIKDNGVKIPAYLDMSNEIKPLSFRSPENEKAKQSLKKFRDGENVAGFAKASASSTEGEGKTAEFAIDGNIDTRWASASEDNQWLRLEFSKPVRASELMIFWEDAFATDYSVTIGMTGAGETEIFKTDKGAKGLIQMKIPDMPFSYLLVKCLKRGTQWGFSIREIGIFSKSGFVPGDYAGIWRALPSEGKWTKEDVIVWNDGGFGLAPDASRNYGCVESVGRFPLTKKGAVFIDVPKTVDSSMTLQLQTFDKNGKFLAPYDLAKDATGPFKRKFEIGGLNLDPAAAEVNFKIWMGSPAKGSVEFKDFYYCY